MTTPTSKGFSQFAYLLLGGAASLLVLAGFVLGYMFLPSDSRAESKPFRDYPWVQRVEAELGKARAEWQEAKGILEKFEQDNGPIETMTPKKLQEWLALKVRVNTLHIRTYQLIDVYYQSYARYLDEGIPPPQV